MQATPSMLKECQRTKLHLQGLSCKHTGQFRVVDCIYLCLQTVSVLVTFSCNSVQALDKAFIRVQLFHTVALTEATVAGS